MRAVLRLAVAIYSVSSGWAAESYYAGGMGGLSTLLYKPENGPALNLFLGRYVGEYFSIQANLIWNTNDLTLISTSVSSQGTSYYSETRGSSQIAGTGDALVFFRNRDSRLRPYLSVGAGVVRLHSSQQQIQAVSGASAPPSGDFSSSRAVLRVPVGIDVRLGRGFYLRYSFSESISGNPISDRLSPPGQRGLKNFQNLWGLLKAF
jgi:hypothetical protein